MDDLCFDDFVDRKCDLANQKVYLSSSITMTATGSEAFHILKDREDALRQKLIVDHGLTEVNELPQEMADDMRNSNKLIKLGNTEVIKLDIAMRDALSDSVDAIGKEDKCSVKSSVQSSVKRKTIDKHKNVTTELLMDTEQYRIDEIFALLKATPKDTTRQQAVRYLLSYSDLLDKDMAREVIDIANKMLTDVTVRDTVKVKIASDLKAFLGTAGKKKFVRSTFEELRKEDGFLEVEVPD